MVVLPLPGGGKIRNAQRSNERSVPPSSLCYKIAGKLFRLRLNDLRIWGLVRSVWGS